MNQKEIRELIEFLVEKDIAEFELERGDVKLRVKRSSTAQPAPVVHMTPVMSVPAVTGIPLPSAAAPSSEKAGPATPASPGAEAAADADLFVVKSPIVGTFYESASPGAPPFVKVGDPVQEGQVLCIVEAMKLMNEIEAEVSGVIAKMFVSNGSPVEYGMPLFGIRKQ